MAKQVITLITDDISGETGDDVSAHTFSVDGVFYEIDLGADNYDKLLEVLSPYIRSGRKTGAAAKRGPVRRRAAEVGPDPATVRAWAKEQGIAVSPRGRVPKDVIEKYNAAH
ncbi:histone-like nucleoid-structuring protein Lsr2 [Streptomyces sp. UG1]|uniref:histone-like nucleoid-structuring protein Lsr2 n=1 Tax=Streptomyces sp. UG1 TaxID=3417652 RepID=UPI003CEEC52D